MTRAVLAIDTCYAACTVAVQVEGNLFFRCKNLGTGHAEVIAPLTDEVLEKADLTPSDIDRLGVTVGPGSFMGVRVGVSFAKGFALAHQTPTVPLPSLAAIAETASQRTGWIAMDAKRGEVMLAPAASPSTLSRLPIEAAKAHIGSDPVVGTGAPLLRSGVAPSPAYPSPEALLALTEAGTPGPLTPVYGRPPDAKPAKHARAL